MNEKINRKGSLFRWTEASSRWYEEASAFTGYHDRLKEEISPFLSPEDRCCELACGTGSLARVLAPLVASYTANDLDPHAVAWLNRKLEESPQPGLEVVPGDWQEVLQGRQFDTILFSYFGVVFEHLDQLLAMGASRLIIIAPREDAWRKKRKDRENSRPDRGHGRHSFETWSGIRRFLMERGISFTGKELDLEFGQPFFRLEDAEAYIRYYYSLEDSDVEEFIRVKLEPRDFGWYYPKLKKIGLIAADLSENRD